MLLCTFNPFLEILIIIALFMVGFWKRTRCSDLSGNALKVEEMGPKGLRLEARMAMAGKAKERKAAEGVAEEAVANTTMAEAENAEKEVAVETAAKGTGMQAAAAGAAAKMVPRKSAADEGTGTMVAVETPVASTARAAKGKGKPAVAVTVA